MAEKKVRGWADGLNLTAYAPTIILRRPELATKPARGRCFSPRRKHDAVRHPDRGTGEQSCPKGCLCPSISGSHALTSRKSLAITSVTEPMTSAVESQAKRIASSSGLTGSSSTSVVHSPHPIF